MFAYYISNVGNLNGEMLLQLGIGQNWETFEPGTAPIYVSPHLDYHTINGQMFLNNKVANLIECNEETRVGKSGVFILALNNKDAKEMLSRE